MFRWDLHVPDNTATDKAILQGTQLRIPIGIDHLDVEEFNVEVLVHGMQSTRQDDIVLELYSHLLTDQCLEEGIKDLLKREKKRERESFMCMCVCEYMCTRYIASHVQCHVKRDKEPSVQCLPSHPPRRRCRCRRLLVAFGSIPLCRCCRAAETIGCPSCVAAQCCRLPPKKNTPRSNL